MLSLYHDHYAERLQALVECIRDVGCQTFLQLQAARERLGDARDLGKSQDVSIPGNVSNVALAHKGAR